MRTSGHPGREVLLTAWEDGCVASIQGLPMDVPPDVDLLGYRQGVVPAFLSSIPERVRLPVARFTFRQLLMLRLVRHCAEAEDLLGSNPLLLWLLAGAVNPSTFPFEKAVAAFRMRRKEILKYVLNSHSESQVRLLGRMRGTQFDERAYLLIARALQSPTLVEYLRHFESVQVPLLECLIDCPGLVKLRLFRLENEADPPSIHRLKHVRMLYQDCLRYSEAHGEANLLGGLRCCRSITELAGLHRSLQERYDTVFLRHRALLHREEDAARMLRDTVERYERELRELHEERERKRRAAVKRGEFPLPPYPGTELIVPIRTPAQLRVEGEAMGNCVGDSGYVRKGMSGTSAYYRIYYPERCTLELRRTRLRWEVGELKAERNADPRPQTRRFVSEWLSAADFESRRADHPIR
jgi:hypothetical protein